MKNGCVELVTVNGRPLSCLEDSGFQKNISPFINGRYGSIAINSTNIREQIPERAKEIRSQLANEFKGRLLSLKVDSAKRRGQSVLGKLK